MFYLILYYFFAHNFSQKTKFLTIVQHTILYMHYHVLSICSFVYTTVLTL